MDPSTAWKNKLEPMAGARWPIRCGHAFTSGELARLRDGLWPRDMDDRWVVWLDGATLRCWRSWTRTCIYESQILINEDGSGCAAVLDVLDAPDTYRRASTETSELERFEGVLSQVWRREDEGSAQVVAPASQGV